MVSENGADLVGILSDRDILDAIADHGTDVLGESVGSVMTAKVFTCSREDRVSAIMALMTDRRIRHVPVVEKDGRLCGMVSIGDVVKQRLDDIQGEADALREYVTNAMLSDPSGPAGRPRPKSSSTAPGASASISTRWFTRLTKNAAPAPTPASPSRPTADSSPTPHPSGAKGRGSTSRNSAAAASRTTGPAATSRLSAIASTSSICTLYRLRLVGHRIGAYAARATGESCSSRMAAGGLKPCRSISQVAL